jgi:hypothetical protein
MESTAKVGCRPHNSDQHPPEQEACTTDISAILRTVPVCATKSPMASSRMPPEETAGPSPALRSGRDDKGEGGDLYQELSDRMDRKKQQVPALRSGLDVDRPREIDACSTVQEVYSRELLPGVRDPGQSNPPDALRPW